MKQLFLALALIALPIGLFAAAERAFAPAAAPHQASALGAMADLKAIVADTSALVAKPDLTAATARITDFETAWDDQEPSLRPMAEEDWGRVDSAADGAISALRAANPDAQAAAAALTTLAATLADPTGTGAPGSGPQMVSGIAVTDASGHPIPCEDMLTAVRGGLAGATLDDTGKAQVADLQAQATERCNADDDAHADAFSAQALAALAAK